MGKLSLKKSTIAVLQPLQHTKSSKSCNDKQMQKNATSRFPTCYNKQ
jgi:hypothetical protein